MSSSLWDQLSVSTGSLLTNEECMQLLDTDINIFDDKDLLKNFPTAGTKSEYDGYHFQDEATSSLYPPSPPETKPSRAELANDILEQLDNTCKQETIFPPWLEEKADLHIFENLPKVAQRVEPLPVTVPMHVAPAPAFNTPQPTEELLREFENVFDAVELTHLTPPQSPPGPATQLLLNYAQQAQHTTFSSTILPVPSREQWPVSAPVQIPQTVPDYSYVDVEELVRNRAAQLSSPQHSGGSISGSSPQSSPPSSPRSSSTDDEWSAPCRSKPYSRSTDDRRSRKKEQNKNAATRYRQKKKAQIEVLLTEEQTMRKRNSELNDKCSDLQREIRYLKGLMRDLFKAKGLIK